MFRSRFFLPVLLLAASLSFAQSAPPASTAAQRHIFFHVRLPRDNAPAGGRMLVFMEKADAAKAETRDGKVDQIDFNPFHPTDVDVAAKEVTYLAPGATVDVDTDNVAYPSGFSHLPPGDYLAQVVLDGNHNYAYGGRGEGDLISEVVPIHLDATTNDGPTLTLNQTVPPFDADKIWNSPRMSAESRAARNRLDRVDFVSPSLSAFFGRPVTMKAWVVRPPGYEQSQETFPVMYYTHGFGGNIQNIQFQMAALAAGMAAKKYPPMIVVGLDESCPGGTHEFADSKNNGPWGEALTTEFIPYLESKYRMDAKVTGRFLNGHSSGGWATMWLQTRYPKVFGGTWSTSPDPTDFHDFTGPDLYAPHANVYKRPDGTPYPLVRENGKVIATMEQFARMERVLGAYGGQISSFDWVFSPRGPDGRPQPMFNRDTGDVNPEVVQYWHDHFDIAHLVTANWATLKPDLDGKIHLYVGTADTFYLDGAAHKLQAALQGVGANASFTFIPGRTHFDLYKVGDDRAGLFKEIMWQMYAVARPGSTAPAK